MDLSTKKILAVLFAAFGGCWMALGQPVVAIVFLVSAVKVVSEI